MRNILGRTAATALVGGLLAVTPAGPAGAADDTVGDATPGTESCGRGAPVTYLQTGSATGTHTVRRSGVITSFTTAGIAGGFEDVVFALGRADGFGGYTVVGASEPVTPAASDTVVRRAVRLPTLAGDVIGLNLTAGVCQTPGGLADTYASFDGKPGGPLVPRETNESRFRFSVAATVEPDADADGFGDTTQDLCPSEASTQAGCSSFTRVRKVRISGRTVVGRTVRVKKSQVAKSFAPAPGTVRVQWLRGSQKIKGARKPAYRLTRADAGRKIAVRITLGGGAPATTFVVKGKRVRR